VLDPSAAPHHRRRGKTPRRRFIGIERDATYLKAAEQRIAAVAPLPAASLAAFQTARDAPRVPFAALIERGMIAPGADLFEPSAGTRRLVRADGAIALGGAVGRSIAWCAGAGPGGLQRLDLLARGNARARSRSSTRCGRW